MSNLLQSISGPFTLQEGLRIHAFLKSLEQRIVRVNQGPDFIFSIDIPMTDAFRFNV